MLSDIEIAQSADLEPIAFVAEKLGIHADALIAQGRNMAKLDLNVLNQNNRKSEIKRKARLILVTAISPTPAGEGKTTTTIGLADALNLIDKKAIVCLREPSLGPVFGMKGGATGGGYSQVLPMENINLHFTGDFHAITSANNLLAALIDNHIYHGNTLDIDPKNITWRRCLDVNDRALRRVSLHQQKHNTESGFDITVASEVMAIFCLAENLDDLKLRLGRMQIAKNSTGKAIFASDLQAQGAMTALLKEAFNPNLVQTIAHTPALIHGGPFANIAHGCNSVVATKAALNLADYVVTEAGFGADLGAEKFFDIKCRQSGIRPDIVVIVATIRSLKYHGGADLKNLSEENITFLTNGISNLKRHILNLKTHFGMQVIVAINHFEQDTLVEVDCLKAAIPQSEANIVLCKHWAQGGAGAVDLALEVVNQLQLSHSQFNYLYSLEDNLLLKLETIAKKIYGAERVELSEQAAMQLNEMSKEAQNLPVCIAKTQYSFSSDPNLRGAPVGHTLRVRELRLSRGAGFVVAICGDIMTMPGLPKTPASEHIDVSSIGQITGLS